MNEQLKYTPAWAIETYLGVREEEREDKKEFDSRSAARKAKMDILETYLLGTMNQRHEEQIKTSAGTAYRSPQMRVTMEDRQAVIDFVILHNSFDLFTNHVNKEAVKELLDAGTVPPGIKIDRFVQCNIRKA